MSDGMPAAGAYTVLDRWDALVDPRVGVIRELAEVAVDDDEPDFFHYLSTACDTSAFTALRNFGNNGGAATTHESAIAKAIGEGVERYCAAIFDEEELVWASFEELEAPATPPDSFALHSAEQHAAPDFPWQPFSPSTRVAWRWGTSLVSGSAILVPAACVHVPYHYRLRRGDTPVMQPISTGLACGESVDAATLGGLCEAIERDAFTITWQARLSRPRIARSSIPAQVEDRLLRFEASGLEVAMMDITTDLGCPTALTVALGSAPTSPAVAVSAACDPSPGVALVKSLEELAHTRKFAAQLMDLTPHVALDPRGTHDDVETQRHHLRAYCPREAVEAAAFLWAAAEQPLRPEPEPADPAERVQAVVADLAAAGLEPVACDLTTPDIEELGLAVVRVVVPGLHPLFMGHRNRALGGRRLFEVPRLLGQEGLEPGEADNPFPHPFP